MTSWKATKLPLRIEEDAWKVTKLGCVDAEDLDVDA